MSRKITDDRPRPPQRPRVQRAVAAELAPDLIEPGVTTRDLVLTELELTDEILAGTTAEYAELSGSRFSGVRLNESSWRHSGITDCSFSRCDFAGADFGECGWRRVEITDSRLTGTVLATCRIKDTVISDSVIDLGNVRFADLRRVRFEQCRLTGADFSSATLTDVVFADCDLTEAEFSNARMTDVGLERCELVRLVGIAGLAGATIGREDLLQVADSLADALGIRIA